MLLALGGFSFLLSIILSLALYYQHQYTGKLKKELKECQSTLSEEKLLRDACEKHVKDMEIDYTNRLKKYANQIAKMRQENRFSQIVPPSSGNECEQLKSMLIEYKKIELGGGK
jgi:predicted Holliday junction resolvase-like endonuclease